MPIEKINFSYPNGTLQSVFDGESKTALELAALTSKKVDECVDLVNGVEQIAIEATAVVDEMKLAQDQFITENADVRASLVNDNQVYLDGLQTAYDAYQTNLNTSKTTFETTINNAITAFQTDANADLDAFEASIETAKTDYQNSANTALTTFQNDMTIALNAFKATLDTEKTTYTDALDAILINGQNAVANIGTSVSTEVTNKINTMASDGTLEELINGTLLSEINASLDAVTTNTNKNTDDVKRITTVLNLVENTDVTTILNNAFANMINGESIRIPKGTYKINHVILEPKDGCTYDFTGAIFQAINTSGYAFKIGNDTVSSITANIKGLRIINTADYVTTWGSAINGIQLVNLNDSYIEIKRITGFYRNIELCGKNGLGICYNNIFIYRSDVCKYGLYLTCDTNGWCNENNFYGGEYQFTSALTDMITDDSYLLYVDYNSVHQINDNHFYSPSFEGVGTTKGHAFYIDGTSNQLVNYRIENIGNGIIGIHGTKNMITIGFDYGDSTGAITDNGSLNTITDSHFMRKHGSGANPIFQAKHQAGGSYKNFSGLYNDGSESFYADSYGRGYFAREVTAIKGFRMVDTTGLIGIFYGGGNPNGVITASMGSLYINLNGGAGVSLYVKESGSNTNTGWVAK